MVRSCRRWFTILVVVAGLILGPMSQGRAQEGAAPPSTPAGGDERPPGRELLLQAAIERLPEAPALVRLTRLTFASLGLTTEAGRPGPTFVLIESGNLTIEADDPAIVLAADGDDEPAPVTGIVSLGPGDRLAVPADTAYTMRHDGGAPAVTLVAVILPAGEGDAAPAADIAPDARGLTVQPLGEGVATVLPPDRAAVTLERFVLTTGLGVPSYPGPVLVAVEAGGFASTLDAGDIQLAPGGRAAVQPTVAPGQAFAVETGDAVFFPEGMEATPPLTGDGDLVLLRLGILPLPAASSPAGATGDDVFAVGATVVVTTPGLRLRATPMTDGAILAELAAGQLLIVTGPPATGGGLVWYPVQDPTNPAVTGFVAADFVAPLD